MIAIIGYLRRKSTLYTPPLNLFPRRALSLRQTAFVLLLARYASFEYRESAQCYSLCEKLSVTEHVDDVINLCAWSMYAISVLRSHGKCAPLLQQVFQSVVISKITYAAPAWWRPSFVELIDLVCGSMRRLPRN